MRNARGFHITDKPNLLHDNKFIVTENQAFFRPFKEGEEPAFIDMLSAIHALESPATFMAVDQLIEEERIILGYLRKPFLERVYPLQPNTFSRLRLSQILHA